MDIVLMISLRVVLFLKQVIQHAVHHLLFPLVRLIYPGSLFQHL